MELYTVSFFGHRQLDRPVKVQQNLEQLIRELILSKDYVEFLVGRNGEFDIAASAAFHQVRKTSDRGNCSLVLVLPYMTAEYENNKESFEEYYDEIEIFDPGHYKSAFRVRNRAMVDKSDLVICFIEYKEGGAYQTVCYAEKNNKKIINIAETIRGY